LGKQEQAMREMRAFGLFMLAAAFLPLHPDMAHAQTGYAQLKLSDAQNEAMSSRQYRTCMDRANGITANMNDCIGVEYDRLDRRLNLAYRAAMGRLPAARRTALRNDERAWLGNRDAVCEAELEAGMDNLGSLERLQLRFCALRELRRRIVWLERMR
jgi:uncharacterized protein YecT (DUF1311 family)